MALIKTIDEIRAVIPRISKLSSTASLPNLDKAAWKYIIPLIGQPLYDDLNTKYNDPTPTLSADELVLLKLIQLPLAAGAFFDELPFMHTAITDHGIRTPETSSMRASQKWEYGYLKTALVTNIVEGQEMLLNYLFINKADWGLWTGDVAYTTFTSYIIRNGLEFDLFYKLQEPMRTFQLLKPIMDDVNEMYMVSKIGRAMMAWLKDQTSLVVTENGGEIDVLKLVKKAMAFFTVKHAAAQQQVSFNPTGFTVPVPDPDITGTGATEAQIGEINKKTEAANREGQNYLSKAAFYLKGINAGDFPEAIPGGFTAAFENSPLYVAPGIIQEAVTNGNNYRKGVFRLGS